ncbi:SUMO-specific isopeptidase USPL1 isoform X2 [Heterodontus francisci]|uniref:SUMO-specific isopeptidase USPL1 isoform X2 n=2 Tax=Heterodontus francisci TaxID=7792 RepID=UPI00355BEE82
MVTMLSENTSLSLQEYCPACTAKGEKKVLRRYCISLEESVLLCENPQCVFPLGCKPLNEILISPQPSYAAKNTFGSGSLVPLCKRSVKRQKTSICNNKDTWDSFRDAPKEAAFQPIENSLNSIDNFVSCSKNGSNHKSVNSSETDGMVVPDKPILVVPDQLCGKRKEPPTESEHSGQTRLEVPNVEQLYLQWKNTSALCWLDCILIALVHLKVMRKVIPNLGTEMESPVKKLCTEYDQACALVSKCRSHRKGNGLWKIPHKTLAQMELILNNIRESLFQLLQPKLRCEMGVPDSPVFAFPHLLRQDPYVEALFMQSYIWSFECMKCGYKYDERCMKTLTTFTKIVSDWHPLNAVHTSPCNKCQDKGQRRKMLLDRVSSIYMLHFVDGLPHTDLDAYRFDFQSNSYRICTIIQYLQDVKHFVTWIQNSDGSWLECDDLKGSSSCRHSTLKVPAHEVHIVVWENTTLSSNILLPRDSSSAICISAPFFKSDATSFVSQLLCETSLNSPVQLSSVEKPMLSTFTEITAPNVNCVKENDEQGTSNSNLLSGLEHLADDAVVTLNLVEIKVDSEGNPIDNTQFIPSAQQCDFQGEQKNPFLQKSSLVTQMTVDHNVSVQPCTVIQYNNEKCQQMDQPTVVKPDMPQKYILPSDAPFCPPRASQLQATDTADVKSAVVQKDSTVKKLTSPAACPIQEIETASVGSDIPVQPNRKTQKKGCIKIPPSPILRTPTVNGSSADVSRPPAANRSFAVGWTRSLLNRHLSTLTSNEPRILSLNEVNAHKGGVLLKMTDPKHPIKEHFDGFKIKNLSKHAQKTAKNLPVTPNSNIPNIACMQNGNHLPRDSGNMKENCKVLLPKTVSSGVHTLNKAFLSNSSKYANPITCETGTSNIKNQSSVPVKKTEPHHIDSKAHNLRLKLLKKLQVKKDQLASLDQLMKTKQCGESATEYVGTCSSEAQLKLTNNGSMMYDDVLNELWRELGVEDKSVCTASSSASLSSSPSHHELLAELFTPATTTITSGCMQSNHLRLCGMSTDGVANCELSNGCIIGPRTANGDHTSPPISALQVQHHAYKNESVSVANAFASVFESPTKEEMLVDLLSTSTLNSLTGDHEDELPNFDENLFENC